MTDPLDHNFVNPHSVSGREQKRQESADSEALRAELCTFFWRRIVVLPPSHLATEQDKLSLLSKVSVRLN